ncbi:MAG: phosphohistidine phosphatase SixA [Candidatus Omnitrophota bacterium]|jgi:phosphohistidine phosphatase SixA
MELYLMRHGEALSASKDPLRGLSSEGRSQARRTAGILKERGIRPTHIWHSSKLRAKETALEVSRVLSLADMPRQEEGLDPDDQPDRTVMAVDALACEQPEARLLIVSHLPFLPHLVAALENSPGGLPTTEFPEAGIACLSPNGRGTWRIEWQATPDGEIAETVQAFFEHWKTYQKAMDCDYLGHRGAYETLGRFLARHPKRTLSLLDLGCGDAGFMSRTLPSARISKYHGVDQSEIVLEMAKKEMGRVACPQVFTASDFEVYLNESPEKVDLVWIGLSMHHVPSEGKADFLAACRRHLNPGGSLLVYEPMRVHAETREAYLARWEEVCRTHWPLLEDGEKKRLTAHVRESDFPEDLRTCQALGQKAGFKSVESLYQDPYKIHELVCFHA